MVSEHPPPPRRSSYAAAVSGEASQERQTTPPISRSPVRTASTTIPQRNLNPQTQRNYGAEDVENPFFLNANDNPSTILVSPPLLGSSNYSSWRISMRMALEIKNKWCIVDGSLSAPSMENNLYAAWRRCNLMVCSWIFRSVHSSIAQSIMHLDQASAVWNDLKKRFAQCDAQRISALQNDINNFKQGTMSVSDYYTRCVTMWEEMNALRPLPVCKCNPRCACDLMDTIRKEREIDQVICFLQGLSDDFNSLKSNVLVQDPLPEVDKVFVMAEKVERQISFTNLNINSLEVSQANMIQTTQTPTDEMIAAVNMNNNRRYMSAGGTKAKCVYCGMTGHTIDKCYKKHGYPPGWVPGYKSKTKQQNTTSAVNNMSDLGVSTDQFQKLMHALQSQMGQPSTSNTTAAISLVPNFKEENNEVCDSGTAWDDGWFS